MNILVIGRGGREHALIWKLSQSPLVKNIFAAAGNSGIARIAKCVDIKAENIYELFDFARKNEVDMTIAGPEVCFTTGIVDLFSSEGLTVFGPTRKGSTIETSKAYAKQFMNKNGIPTTSFGSFSNQEEAFAYIEKMGSQLVIKADGLTAGRGAIFAHDEVTAKLAVSVMLKDRVFGHAGDTVIIEEYLKGREITVLAFTDGETIVPMPSVEVNYSAFDSGRGPITGGMGACSPSKGSFDMPLADVVRTKVLEPALKGLKKEKLHYRGVLYTRLVLTDDGPKVVEFNVRYGDPETQCLMPRLKTDLVEILIAIRDKKLKDTPIEWDERQSLCTVLTSGGYPMRYETGYPIKGLVEVEKESGAVVFHAGTTIKGANYLTAGGRVLNIVTLGSDRDELRKRGVQLATRVEFSSRHFRSDIGA